MAGEGKFGLNIEAVYVNTDAGPVPLLEHLEDSGGADVDWGSLAGKPSVFPPEDHEHAAGDITSGTLAADRVPSLPQSKVTGLAAALDDKQDAGDYATTSQVNAKADQSALADLEARVAALEADEG